MRVFEWSEFRASQPRKKPMGPSWHGSPSGPLAGYGDKAVERFQPGAVGPQASAPLVYFALSRLTGLVKIGTTRDLPTHRKTLGDVEVLGTMPGFRAAKESYQDQYAHLKVDGDWFRPGSDLMTFIREVTRPLDDSGLDPSAL